MNITGNNNANNLFGTINADNIRGLGGDDLIVGGNGDDFIRGDAGADQIFGGNDDDRIVYDAADLSGSGLVDGGAGEDTILSAGAASVLLDDSNNMSNIEVIDLNDFAANVVEDSPGEFEINPVDVALITDARNTIRIEGELGDSIDLNAVDFTYGGFVDGYQIYTGDFLGSTVTVQVDPEVDVV